MPRVSRSRTIRTDPGRVWDLVADPHNLPRWWPRTLRVEEVRGKGARARWTAVLATDRGSGVRADFRCTAARDRAFFEFSQDIPGTPFERILKASSVSVELESAPAGETAVSITSDESLRGLSKLGARMMRSAARDRLDEALDGMERALVGEPG